MSKEKILDFFELRDKIEQVVKSYVQDKSIPLDDRWEIFEKSGFGNNPCYIQHLKSLHKEIVMCEGLIDVTKYENISVFRIIEDYEDDEDDEEWQKYKFDPIAFKEECLEKFLKGWNYDW